MKIFYLAGFGLAGIFARYFLNEFASTYVTFFINLLGSFLIGIVYVLAVERGALAPEMRTALMVGLLGGFTTFSAFSLEVAMLVEHGRYFYAVSYLVLSPVLGVLGAMGGIAAARAF